MKKLIILLTSCLLVSVISCTTQPNARFNKERITDEAVDKRIHEILAMWSENVVNLDEELFNTIFDPWADVVWMDGKGRRKRSFDIKEAMELLKTPLNSGMMLSSVKTDSVKIIHNTEDGYFQGIISVEKPRTRILFEFTKPDEQIL